MSITIKDIANLANVSIATVSRVLNNKADGISEETKNRIFKIAKDLNYRPNAIARGLVLKKTNTIGLVLPDISNPFFPEIARGVEDTAKYQGYNVFLCNTDEDIYKEAGYIKALKDRQVDGIIFAASAIKNNEIITKHVGRIPFILIDRRPDEFIDAPGVFLDNFVGGYLGAKHLIEKGHKNIIFISGPLQSHNAKQRLNGFSQAFSEVGLTVKEDFITEGNFKRSCGYTIVDQLLQDKKDFSAIFASNDLMAVGALEALGENGKNVPHDVAVVGFDNIYLSKVVTPKLTTISQPTYQMGAKAAEMLLSIINNAPMDEQQVFFTPQLVVRASS